MTPPLPQLGYSPHPPPWHQRRRELRGLVAAALGGLALLLLWQGPSLWRGVRERYWRHQCANYVAPADRVVYEEDPSRAAPLLQEGGATARLRSDVPTAFVAMQPHCWTSFTDVNRDGVLQAGALVFLHGRATPSGNTRLICLMFTGWNGRRWEFAAHVYRRNGYTQYLTGTAVPFAPGASPLRLFAGQPDVADPSHFTVTYEVNGQKGTLEGWIDDREAVTLQVRDEPANGG